MLSQVRVVVAGEAAVQYLLTLSRHDTIREVRTILLRSFNKRML
jgi:hypothetical protein